MSDVERWLTPDACRATDCSWRQLEYWRRCGYLFPQGGGSGNYFRWSFDDLLRATVIRSVCVPGSKSDQGAPRRIGPRIAIASLDADFLVLEPHLASIEPEEIVEWTRAHPFVTVVALAPLRAKLRDRLTREPAWRP